MQHDPLCAKYGFDSDPGQDVWGYEPPVRPCDCVRFSEVRKDERGSVIHECPPSGSGIMPCCGRTPFEVSRTDRMTLERADVTCGRPFTRGYAVALADAIEAVKEFAAYPMRDGYYDLSGEEGVPSLIAAIEALAERTPN